MRLTTRSRQYGFILFLGLSVAILPACKKSAASESVQSGSVTPAANLPNMEGKKVYFVAIGDFPDNVMQDFVSFYKQKFNLDVQVLKTITPDPRLFDGARQQLAAEPLVDSVHAAFPEVANDPGAVLIGLTTSDIYPTSVSWQFAFGWRKGDLHTAVVSAARMGIHYAGEPDEVAKPEVRMRKMISKDIGMLYYGLAQSNNPRSVLYNQIGGIEELDAVGEDF